MTKTELERKIDDLKQELRTERRYPTEIYTRIVGYYRSLANWNAGKREEYDHRKTFEESTTRSIRTTNALGERESTPSKSTTSAKATRALLFTQPRCPQCPAMKKKTSAMTIECIEFDTDTDEGFRSAQAWNVTATPTLIVLDSGESELARITSATDWKSIETLVADSPIATA